MVKEPTVIIGALSEVVRAIIPLLIIFNILHWTPEQIAQVLLFVGVLVKSAEVMYTRSQVVPTVVANKQIETATTMAPGTPVEAVIKATKEGA